MNYDIDVVLTYNDIKNNTTKMVKHGDYHEKTNGKCTMHILYGNEKLL